jgi:MFS family permease
MKYEILKISDFRNFIAARFLAVIAVQIQRVAVGWQVFSLTNDTFAIGLVSLCEIIPSICVSFFSGLVADKVSRKKIILLSCTVLLACSLSLFFVTKSDISNKVFSIYGIIFISGIARGFLHPSLAAFMSQLIPSNQYQYSAAWNSISWQVGAVIGPLLGGLLYGFMGPELCYGIDSIFLLGAIFFYILIKSKPIPEKIKSETLWESLTLGFRFVFSNQILLGAMSLDLFAVLFGGVTALLPKFARDVLFTGPQGLGMLRSSIAVGAALMAVSLAYYPIRENAGKKLLFSVMGFGVSILLFALSTNLYLSVFFLALSGMFDSVSVVLRSTIVQLYTPDSMRGRVSSVNSIFIGSSNEIGDFESGTAAKIMGLVPSVIFGGTMTLIVVFVTYIKAPILRNLNLHNKNE